jgi:hypothetical protein
MSRAGGFVSGLLPRVRPERMVENTMRLPILGVACVLLAAPLAAADTPAGRWSSNDNYATTGKAGSRFFLDVIVAPDGSFKGSWEEYVCFNYSGPYGIVTVSCQRSKKPSPASGKLDAAGAGSIDLARLGKSAFRYRNAPNKKGQPQLDLELPREWLKQDAPVLYEASLNPKSK